MGVEVVLILQIEVTGWLALESISTFVGKELQVALLALFCDIL